MRNSARGGVQHGLWESENSPRQGFQLSSLEKELCARAGAGATWGDGDRKGSVGRTEDSSDEGNWPWTVDSRRMEEVEMGLAGRLP